MSEENQENKKKVYVGVVDAAPIQEIQDIYNSIAIKKSAAPSTTADLIKNAMGATKAGSKVPRLAFEENPYRKLNYAGIYKYKPDLLPPHVIKKIRVANLLVAAIVRTRGQQLSMFGHLRNSRYDIGIEIKIKKQFKDEIQPEELVLIKERIDTFSKTLLDCGKTDGLAEKQKLSLSEFLDLQCKNAVSLVGLERN